MMWLYECRECGLQRTSGCRLDSPRCLNCEEPLVLMREPESSRAVKEAMLE